MHHSFRQLDREGIAIIKNQAGQQGESLVGQGIGGKLDWVYGLDQKTGHSDPEGGRHSMAEGGSM